MTYLDLINSFWKQQRNEQYNSNDWFVYSYLLNEANKNFWSGSFRVSTNMVCVELGISRTTFIKVRNKLKQKNLIDFMEGTRGSKAQYVITSVQNLDINLDTSIDTSINTSIDTSIDTYIGKDIRYKTEDIFSKKDKNKFLSKKSENDFSKKKFSKPTRGKKNEQDFFQSVNSEEEKRKKIAPKKEKRFFTPPSVFEVEAYCTERNNGISAEKFVNFYASKGWMIGKNKMKDWKSAVRTWEQNDKQNLKNQNNNQPLKEPKIGRTPLSVVKQNLTGWDEIKS